MVFWGIGTLFLMCAAGIACGDPALDTPPRTEADAEAGASPPGVDGGNGGMDGRAPLPDAPVGASDASDASSLLDRQVPPTAIAITNPSFELPVTGPNTFVTNAAPPGWQAFGGAVNFGSRTVGVLNPNTSRLYLDAVPDGRNVGVVFLMDNLAVSTEAGMQQILGELLALDTTYTLRVDVGNIHPEQGLPYDFTGFPGYRVELLAGGVVIASDNGTLRPGEGRFLLSTLVAPIGPTHPRAGQALAIRLVNIDGPAGIEVNFDNVRLSKQGR